jgi:hypothetical protein
MKLLSAIFEEVQSFDSRAAGGSDGCGAGERCPESSRAASSRAEPARRARHAHLIGPEINRSYWPS